MIKQFLLMSTIITLVLSSVQPSVAQFGEPYGITSAESTDPQDGFNTVFTPQVNGIQTYLTWLNTYCKKSLYVADFTFTSPEITQAYCNLAKKGVDVHIILDKLESKAVKSEAPLIAQLSRAGCEIIITTSEKKDAIMHLKMSVADGQWVESGSFNYTDVANNQANNLDFNTEPSPKRAALFMKAWWDLYNFAKNQ
jgi:PLD-like domain